MAGLTQIDEDLRIHGKFSSKTLAAPNWIANARSLSPDTIVQATKRSHRHEVSLRLGTIADISAVVHQARAAGKLIALEAALATAPGGDRVVTIDLLKATADEDFVSIAAGAIVLDADHRNCEVCRTAIADDAIVAGDLIAIEVTYNGSSGTVPEDLVATLTWEESP